MLSFYNTRIRAVVVGTTRRHVACRLIKVESSMVGSVYVHCWVITGNFIYVLESPYSVYNTINTVNCTLQPELWVCGTCRGASEWVPEENPQTLKARPHGAVQ